MAQLPQVSLLVAGNTKSLGDMRLFEVVLIITTLLSSTESILRTLADLYTEELLGLNVW
jgi:hypothetical protein